MKGLEKYPAKVLVAWGEAVAGKKEFVDIMFDLNCPELGHFCYALRNNLKARQWLMKNKFPHLVALIEGAEGKKEAIDWLDQHGYTILKHMALAIDGDKHSLSYFYKENKLISILTHKMKFVKDSIEDSNQDPHKINL